MINENPFKSKQLSKKIIERIGVSKKGSNREKSLEMENDRDEGSTISTSSSNPVLVVHSGCSNKGLTSNSSRNNSGNSASNSTSNSNINGASDGASNGASDDD